MVELHQTTTTGTDYLAARNRSQLWRVARRAFFDLKAPDRFRGPLGFIRTGCQRFHLHYTSVRRHLAQPSAYCSTSKTVGERAVFLPFEGDAVLSILLGKAQLLMNDSKITDTSILRQL